MGIRIDRVGGVYVEGRRWRQNWEARDEDTGELVERNRLSFGDPRVADVPTPSAGQVDAEFSKLGWVGQRWAAAKNRLNQNLPLGPEWVKLRYTFLTWLKNNPTATSDQAKAAFDAAFPDCPFDAVKLFGKLLTMHEPPFANFAAFRDYVVANFSTVEKEPLT